MSSYFYSPGLGALGGLGGWDRVCVCVHAHACVCSLHRFREAVQMAQNQVHATFPFKHSSPGNKERIRLRDENYTRTHGIYIHTHTRAQREVHTQLRALPLAPGHLYMHTQPPLNPSHKHTHSVRQRWYWHYGRDNCNKGCQ